MNLSIPIQKAQDNLVKFGLIMGFGSVLAAMLFHFFAFFFAGAVNSAVLNVFVSTPFVIAMIGVVSGMVCLAQMTATNIFGKAKAITCIVLGSVIVVGLVIFLINLLTRI